MRKIIAGLFTRKGMRLFDEGESPIPLTLISSQTSNRCPHSGRVAEG